MVEEAALNWTFGKRTRNFAARFVPSSTAAVAKFSVPAEFRCAVTHYIGRVLCWMPPLSSAGTENDRLQFGGSEQCSHSRVGRCRLR